MASTWQQIVEVKGPGRMVVRPITRWDGRVIGENTRTCWVRMEAGVLVSMPEVTSMDTTIDDRSTKLVNA
jgi:hypothetical protein